MAEANAKGFSKTIEAMEKRLIEFSGYRDSKHFKVDDIAHVVANPREATEALCAD